MNCGMDSVCCGTECLTGYGNKATNKACYCVLAASEANANTFILCKITQSRSLLKKKIWISTLLCCPSVNILNLQTVQPQINISGN